MKKVARFDIHRNVVCQPSNISSSIVLPSKPLRVAILLNEEDFLRTKEMRHHKNAFIDDYLHDWDWVHGKLRYYSHAVATGEKVDLLVVYEFEKE